MNKICDKPFSNIEISLEGDVFTCCPAYINRQKIGNIWDKNTKSYKNIWCSKEAIEIRKHLLKNDYSICNLNICREKKLVERNKKHTLEPPLPEHITLAYDRECNIQCITCRDKKIKNTLEQNIFYKKQSEKVLIPLLKNAKYVFINGSGEAFYSKHSRFLIKEITRTNKDAKFSIITNGLLFNENNCKYLGLQNRIENVCISIHALNEDLYSKIMIGSNLNVVLKNLKWAAEQQKLGNFKCININCVVTNMNYNEIPKLINLAKELNVFISFSVYHHWGTKLDKDYENLSIWKETHPENNNLKEVLTTAKNINYSKCEMVPVLSQLM